MGIQLEENKKKLERAKENKWVIINVFYNVVGIVQSLLMIISFILFAFTISMFLSIAYLIFIILFAFLMNRQGFKEYKTKIETMDQSRRLQYITNILYSKTYAKELRVYEYATYMIDEWKKSNKDIRNKLYKTMVINNIGFSAYQFISYVILGLFFVAAGYSDVGILAGMISIITGVRFGVANFGNTINNLKYNIMQLHDYNEFISSVPKNNHTGIADTLPVNGHIKLENICFSYPSNNEKMVLKNINIEIFPGEKIALVGENGAGKTTLAMIIAGIYKATSGNLYLDGKLYEEYDKNEFRKRIGFVSRNFAHYELSLKENILFDHMMEDEKYFNLKKQLELNDFIESFPKKDQEILRRSFGNIDLSGGQWQRIALARCFAKETAKVYLLDEPTSALDPKMEYHLFMLFDQLTKNKTSIFISHRLGFIQNADKIFVLKEGELSEQGTHNSLMESGTIYKTLYEAQTQWFDNLPTVADGSLK